MDRVWAEIGYRFAVFFEACESAAPPGCLRQAGPLPGMNSSVAQPERYVQAIGFKE